MKTVMAIAVGGAMGAVSRHYFAAFVMRLVGGNFPFGIMLSNILGSLLMGAMVSFAAHRLNLSMEMRSFITVGFLGAFTTFSTFSMHAVMLFERGNLYQAAAYILGSVTLGIVGFVLGMQLGKLI